MSLTPQLSYQDSDIDRKKFAMEATAIMANSLKLDERTFLERAKIFHNFIVTEHSECRQLFSLNESTAQVAGKGIRK